MDSHAVRSFSYVAFAALLFVITLLVLFAETSWSAKAQLTIVGGSLEVIGLALVSVDFWWPWLRKSMRVLGREAHDAASSALERARQAAVRLFRRPKVVTGQTAGLGIAFETNTAGHVTPGKTPSLAQMVQRLYEIEARLGAIESRQESQSQEFRDQLDAVTAAAQEMIRRSKDEYLGWRILGFAVAVSGAVVLSAANLVS